MVCGHCGAVFRTPRRERSVAEAVDDPLTSVFPAPMVKWLRAEYPGEEPVIPADRSGIIDWYSRYDRFVLAAGESRAVQVRYEAICGTAPVPGPDFKKVLTAVQAACFDPALAARRMDVPPHERFELARRWWAGPGRASAWISGEGEPLTPDPEAAGALLEPGALTGGFDRARSRALGASLFGVEKAPQVRLLVEQFGEERLREAVAAQLADGSRPLREAVLRLLDGAPG